MDTLPKEIILKIASELNPNVLSSFLVTNTEIYSLKKEVLPIICDRLYLPYVSTCQELKLYYNMDKNVLYNETIKSGNMRLFMYYRDICHIRNATGRSIKYGHLEIFKLLIEKYEGTTLYIELMSSLELAVEYEQLPIVKYIVDYMRERKYKLDNIVGEIIEDFEGDVDDTIIKYLKSLLN